MHDLAGQFWTLVAIVTGVVVLGILHVLASAARNQLHLHDLRVRVNTLRRQRLEQLRDLAQNQNADIEVVDEFADVEIEEPPSKSRRAA
jgi:uncharacterized protein YnzC (UPF0291/DUF896 family)